VINEHARADVGQNDEIALGDVGLGGLVGGVVAELVEASRDQAHLQLSVLQHVVESAVVEGDVHQTARVLYLCEIVDQPFGGSRA
jgi:hypothetical protein